MSSNKGRTYMGVEIWPSELHQNIEAGRRWQTLYRRGADGSLLEAEVAGRGYRTLGDAKEAIRQERMARA